MKKIKIGFVGLGDHALQSHLELLLENHHVEIVGAFDPDIASFERVKKEYDVQLTRFETYPELLEVVEAVFICSPDKFHFEQMREAVKAGVHVFCEKPMCCDVMEFGLLHAVFRHAEENNLVVSTCHPRRFDPPYLFVKENLENWKKNYGDVISLTLDFTYHKPDGVKDLHGGSMLQDHINHELDYMNFIFGVEKLTAYKLIDEFDRYQVSGIREDKIAFTFGGTRRLDCRLYSESIEIRFEKGTVHIETKSADSYFYYHDNNENPTRFINIYPPQTDYDVRFKGLNDNFINAILGKEESYISYDEMLLNSKASVIFRERHIISL
ncbi:MAG: Gfo/Idh/MocA family oxidoreductase [Alphaproteobacteria bacterium]|nr:Gfo/Idh/MocA family oxidoreductase [Alphaproteobacteria bacterium]